MATAKLFPKKRVLYSNYDLSCMYDDAARHLLGEHGEEWGWRTVKDIPESKIWDEVYFTDGRNREDFMDELEKFISEHGTFLLTGSVGLWYGRREGGFLFSSVEELSKAWKDCDYIEFSDRNGHLCLECSHHDGTNMYEIYKVSEKGVQFYEDKDELCWNDEIIYKRMIKCRIFTSLPHFAHTVYGCKKAEYESRKAAV